MSSYEPNEPPPGTVPKILKGAEAERVLASMGFGMMAANPVSDPNKKNKPNRATKTLIAKANKGNARAMSELGSKYRIGDGGLRVNCELAEKWLEKAALKGLEHAMYNLATLLESNNRFDKARMWYQKCADLNGTGRQMATSSLDSMDQKQNLGKYAPIERDAETCGHCGTAQTKEKQLKSCNCHKQFYCDQACQQANWKDHKAACKAARKVGKKQNKQALKTAKQSTSSVAADGKIHGLNKCALCDAGFPANTNFNKDPTESYLLCCGALLCWDCGDRMLDEKTPPYCLLCKKRIPSSKGQSFKALLKLIKNGDGEGVFEAMIAEHYIHGLGCAKSDELSFQWYKKSAQKGYIQAQFQLGQYYSNGIGVKKSPKRALKWYLIAANYGHVSAQYNAGNLYYYLEHEKEVEHNIAEVVRLWTQAAEQEHSWAQVKLGLLYDCGVGVERSLTTAIRYYKRSCDNGNVWGQTEYSKILISGCGLSGRNAKNTLKHIKKALRLLKAAAAQKGDRAMHTLKRLDMEMKRVEPTMKDPAAFLQKWNDNDELEVYVGGRFEVMPLSTLTCSRYQTAETRQEWLLRANLVVMRNEKK